MEFIYAPMKRKYAEEIAYSWKYDGIYSFYDMTADEDDLKEFLEEELWEGSAFAVLDNNGGLIGFFSYTFEREFMRIGFGLKPELTRKGLGASIVSSGIEFGVRKLGYSTGFAALEVASFNLRAINVYEKLRFVTEERYTQKTNGGEFEFIRMKKDLYNDMP